MRPQWASSPHQPFLWQNVKKLAQLETEVDGAVSLTPEEIMFLQEENRELKSWGNVRDPSLLIRHWLI